MAPARPDQLLGIIGIQNEIAAQGLELDRAIALIADGALELTPANTCVIEINRRDGRVLRVAHGEPEPDPRSGDDVAVGRKSVVSAPIRPEGDRQAGLLKAFFSPQTSFEDSDHQALELLAHLAAAQAQAEMRATDLTEPRHDRTTGLLNQLGYGERLTTEADRSLRYSWPLSLCLFELEGLAGAGEEAAGSADAEALRAFAKILAAQRIADDAFRIGPSRFALLMPNTTSRDAALVASRIARAVSGSTLAADGIGFAYGVSETDGDPDQLHNAADARLARAKAGLAEGVARRRS